MLYLVEVRLYGEDSAASMNAARTWLDHHHLKPKMFRVSLAPERHLHVAFGAEGEATAFAHTFGGRLLREHDTLAA
jgi:hypothetical protein